MKKLWKRDQTYYLFIIIVIMLGSIFTAEKLHTMMSKYVLNYYVRQEQYVGEQKEIFAKQIINEQITLEKSHFLWFENAVEEDYCSKVNVDLDMPNQGREVFKGKIREAYFQSMKQANVKNIDYMSEEEINSVKIIFEKKINQIYKDDTGKSIAEDYQHIMKNFSKQWEGSDNYTILVELLNNNPNPYKNMIDQLFEQSYILGDGFGYEEFLDEFKVEFYVIMLFIIFIFLVQILKWRYFSNYEFELTLPISKKSKTIYDLLSGIILVSIPCMYFVIKGVVWQIYYSELGYHSAMYHYLLFYVWKRVYIIWIICILLYLVFYFFKQMSHSLIFASTLFGIFIFPFLLYILYYAMWSRVVIIGLIANILLFVLNIWLGLKDEGSNTKLFKYKSFQLIVNLWMMGILLFVLFYVGEDILFNTVIFTSLLVLMAMINVWIYRYDYKKAR